MSASAEGLSLYAGKDLARTGSCVPLFADGKPAVSLYNPEREAQKALVRLKGETFAVFAGLADGRRVELFLNACHANECIVIEKNSSTFQFLKSFPSARAVMQSRRAQLLSMEGKGQAGALKLKEKIANIYIPALFSSFFLDILPSWQAHCPEEASAIMEGSKNAISEISADFSVQAHFGKIWLINVIKNIYNGIKAGTARERAAHSLPKRGKRAVVAAAGPSLDESIEEDLRESHAIFAADTALPALSKRGIAADVVLSIDGQIFSARHFAKGFKAVACSRRKTVLIIDICGCPAAARRAERLGYSVLFAAGSHPLASCMAAFAPMPRLETSAGTVTAAAVDAAKKLGFAEIASAGADFAFAGGKPYCRGTYLEDEFLHGCSRLRPLETMYAAIMFRSPVRKDASENGAFTYRTDLLDGYKKAVEGIVAKPAKEWGNELCAAFPGKDFLLFLKSALGNLGLQIASHSNGAPWEELPAKLSKEERAVFLSLLPLAAFLRKKSPDSPRENILKSAINLALNIVERYTSII